MTICALARHPGAVPLWFDAFDVIQRLFSFLCGPYNLERNSWWYEHQLGGKVSMGDGLQAALMME
jgi:hypothetical protein